MSIVDPRNIYLHQDIKTTLLDFSVERGYYKIAEVLSRGDVAEVKLRGPEEAVELGQLAEAYRFDTKLKFPYFDDEDENFNPLHDEKFDFANGVVVMKVSFAIQDAYPSHFSSEVDA